MRGEFIVIYLSQVYNSSVSILRKWCFLSNILTLHVSLLIYKMYVSDDGLRSLIILPYLFSPVTLRKNRKGENWRPTRSEIQESFFSHISVSKNSWKYTMNILYLVITLAKKIKSKLKDENLVSLCMLTCWIRISFLKKNCWKKY